MRDTPMRKLLLPVVLTLACFVGFAAEASAQYVMVPPASGYYHPWSSGYRVVPPASGYYHPWSTGYQMVPEASGYYHPWSTGYRMVPEASGYYHPWSSSTYWRRPIDLNSYALPWSPGSSGYPY